jgi:ketosteroid isomerase-like protein
MKFLSIFLLFICSSFIKENKLENELNQLIDEWHLAASQANFDAYFNKMTENSIFIGTAPEERWTKKQFQNFSKPYFDKGKAWDFKSTERNWYFSKDKKTAWFDEKLNTWMLDCRASGVVSKIRGKWKIVFYDLHVMIENEKMEDFLNLRKK